MLSKTLNNDDIGQETVVATHMVQQGSMVNFKIVRLKVTQLQASAGCITHLAHVCILLMPFQPLYCLSVCSNRCFTACPAPYSAPGQCLVVSQQALSPLVSCVSAVVPIITCDILCHVVTILMASAADCSRNISYGTCLFLLLLFDGSAYQGHTTTNWRDIHASVFRK